MPRGAFDHSFRVVKTRSPHDVPRLYLDSLQVLALLKIPRTPEVAALLAHPERWQRFVEKLREKGFFAGADEPGACRGRRREFFRGGCSVSSSSPSHWRCWSTPESWIARAAGRLTSTLCVSRVVAAGTPEHTARLRGALAKFTARHASGGAAGGDRGNAAGAVGAVDA